MLSFAIILGIIFGIISALYKDQWIDKVIQILSTLGMSVPSFFSAIIFAWLFGYVLHKYTNLEMTGSLYELDDFGETINLKLKNLILPALVLGIRPLAVVIQLMRNSLLEVFNQDYILLLTNIVIGKRDRLRLHELLKEFEARGIFFDKQTQKVLVEFYERIGNVERMSDSGDAVYVNKTISAIYNKYRSDGIDL